jgi:hypothetical protein
MSPSKLEDDDLFAVAYFQRYYLVLWHANTVTIFCLVPYNGLELSLNAKCAGREAA